LPLALPEGVVVSGVVDVDGASAKARAPERWETRTDELAYDCQADFRRDDPERPDQDKPHRDQQGYAGVNGYKPGGREATQATPPYAQKRISSQCRDEQQSDEDGFHTTISY
jgi:hypothetical protein